MVQSLLFNVFDIDDEKGDLNKADFIGSVECKLGEIAVSKNSKLTRALKDKKGIITG